MRSFWGSLMNRMLALAAVAAVSFTAPAVAQTVTYNANPATPFTYGSGNDYTPANAAVLTNGTLELASRFHVNREVASPSDSAGVYSFALGTSKINFDFSAVNYSDAEGVSILLTNLKTGDTAYFNNLLIPDGNGSNPGYQGSQQLGFGFLNGDYPTLFGDLNFDANVNNTYRFDLTASGNTLTTFAKVGTGFAAVPEPATWALMILGFGFAGATMRRQQKQVQVKFA